MPAMMPTRTMLTSKTLLDTDTQSAVQSVHGAQDNAREILDTHTVTAIRLTRDEWGPRTSYRFDKNGTDDIGGQTVAIVKHETTAHGRQCWLIDTAPAAEHGEWDYREAAQMYHARMTRMDACYDCGRVQCVCDTNAEAN